MRFVTTTNSGQKKENLFYFSPENNLRPKLKNVSNIIDVPLINVKSNADLKGYGYLVNNIDDFKAEDKTFEIVKWPVSGWRQLDPETGDEAGTTEGCFEVEWKGDYYYAKNLAINTVNNHYLDGLGCSLPEKATHDEPGFGASEKESFYGSCIYLWMTDYHPDGGQLFFPKETVGEGHNQEVAPFYVCLGKNTYGDDILPGNMKGFKIPKGKGLYIHPGTWHNGIYIHKKEKKKTFFTRQGRVHARVSLSWAKEFDTLLRLPMQLE